MLQINQRNEENITIIEFEGRLDAVTSPKLEEQLSAILNENTQQVILQLDKLEFVASAGLRVFLAFAKKVKKADGKLAFCELSNEVLDVFQITGFTDIFSILPTCEEAVQSIS